MDLRVMESLSNTVAVVDALIECLHIELLTLLVVMDDLSSTPSMVLIRNPYHHIITAVYSNRSREGGGVINIYIQIPLIHEYQALRAITFITYHSLP